MRTIPDRARVVVTHRHLTDLHTLDSSIIYIDRHWQTKMRMAIRNYKTGIWDFQDLGEGLPAIRPKRRKGDFVKLDTVGHPAAADVIRSFVRVACTMPLKLNGFPRTRQTGFGLVINAELGLEVVSSALVPTTSVICQSQRLTPLL